MEASQALQLVVRFLVNGVAVLVVAALMPGMRVKSFGDAVAFAVVAAVLNVVAWRVFALVTVPFAALTLGIGYFLVNGLVFLVARRIVRGVEISGCAVATIAAALVGVVNSALTAILTG